jgi:DNA-binding CsgD family transcriptional regulator
MRSRTVVDDGEWATQAAPVRSAPLRDDLAELHARLSAVLRPGEPSPALLDDLTTAIAQLDVDGWALAEGLRTAEVDLPAGDRSRDAIVDLMGEIAAIRPRLASEQEEVCERAFAAIRDASGVLGGVSSIDQLIERAPMAAARLGFDRAFVSSIDDANFVPQACFIRGDPEWAEAILEAGRREPRRLDRHLLETEMIRRRQPIRVQDAQRERGVHPEIAEVSMSRSYVAAPIVVRDEVIGFIHADYYEQRRLVCAQDAANLWMFADAFGQAYERVLLGEQIAQLRASMLEALSGAEHRFAAITDRAPSLRPGAGAVVDGPPGAARRRPVHRTENWSRNPGPDELLTRRELEVLQLMADGATNDGIATRLVISHGTAKTHVKHILRKLGAANRAEAVSRYFQRERESDQTAAVEVVADRGAD